MLDQSFSAKNFRVIFDRENRNGFYVEDKLGLKTIRKITTEIKNCRNCAKYHYRVGNLKLADFFNEAKEGFKEVRNKEIDNVLEQISDKITNKNFSLNLKQVKIAGGKDLYMINNTPESFFALKQVQYNISRLFGVKQSSRHSILKQLLGVLNDKFPKTVIRTDISSFYESIDHKTILKSVNKDTLLSPKSRSIINNILREYKRLSGSNEGVPRGIGVSAYLSELYMRKIDWMIKSIPDVTYYARYVDDIIVVFTPNPNKPARDYLKEVKNTIEKNSSVSTNPDKTFERCINEPSKPISFEFLGYNFIVSKNEVKTKLTSSKEGKVKDRIKKAFDDYENLSVVEEKKAKRLLVKRIRFLTGNTRLANNKSKILIGIYYSNSFLTEKGQLKSFDGCLKGQINTRVSSPSLKKRLNKYSFLKGFEEQRFSPYNAAELKEIMKIWKNGEA